MKKRFAHILRKYERSVTLKRQANAQIQGGRVVEGDTTTYTIEITVLPLTAENIEEYEGGNYTTQDKKIYARESLTSENDTAITLKKNDILVIDGEDYEIRENTPWIDFADFHTYLAKKVVVE